MDESLPPVVASLLAALKQRPDDVPLRLHVAELLLDAGRSVVALQHCSLVLQREPGNEAALRLLQRATRQLSSGAPGDPGGTCGLPGSGEPGTTEGTGTAGTTKTAGATGGTSEPAGSGGQPAAQEPSRFDWEAAEAQLGDIAEPAFVGDGEGGGEGGAAVEEDIERPDVRLDDVGGMIEVKKRLEAAFLTPMRNPELQRLYGKSLSGGLLLWGPPGCGKTFLARAIAGELGARFYAVSIADVLDMWIGASERNLRDIFDVARRNAPCVLFLDEIDAIGQKRAQLRGNSAMRGTVNQLLTEMDSVKSDNKGVFVLGATNHPWDVDTALLRPGRFDRMLLVLPPDAPARESILRYHLRDRPLKGINLGKLVRRTEDFSGADLAHLCDSAAEHAMTDSVASGQVRMIEMGDFDAALREIRPSTGPWLAAARNVALFAGDTHVYDELLAYLKKRRLA